MDEIYGPKCAENLTYLVKCCNLCCIYLIEYKIRRIQIVKFNYVEMAKIRSQIDKIHNNRCRPIHILYYPETRKIKYLQIRL